MSALAQRDGEVAGPGVAQRDGRVLGLAGQQQPERAADGDAAADDADLRPRRSARRSGAAARRCRAACTAAAPGCPAPAVPGSPGAARRRPWPGPSPRAPRSRPGPAGSGSCTMYPVQAGSRVQLADDGERPRPGSRWRADRRGSTRSRPRRSRGACRRRRRDCPGRRRPARCRGPGTTPRRRSRRPRAASSRLTAAAVALPSRIVAVTGPLSLRRARSRRSPTSAQPQCDGGVAAAQARTQRRSPAGSARPLRPARP